MTSFTRGLRAHSSQVSTRRFDTRTVTEIHTPGVRFVKQRFPGPFAPPGMHTVHGNDESVPALQHTQNHEQPVSYATHSPLRTCQLPAARALLDPGDLWQLEAITSYLVITPRGVWESLLRSGAFRTCPAIYYMFQARHVIDLSLYFPSAKWAANSLLQRARMYWGGCSTVESVTPRSGYDCHHSSLPHLSGTLGQINPMFPRDKYTHSHNHLLLGNFYTQLPPHQKKKVLCSVRQPGLQRS